MEEPPLTLRAQLLDANEPLVMTGPPGAVSGVFQVRNAGNEKMRVAGARLRPSAGGKLAMRSRLTSMLQDDGVELRRIIVRPGQSRQVPVALTLDPRTPPGTYHLELQVQDQLRAVLMHVTENVSLRIAPETVVLPNQPGGKVTRHVVFTNDGNVPIDVRSIGTVVLDDELASCRALRGALSDVGDTMTTLDEFASALGKRFKALYDAMVLKVQNAAITLEPGQTESVKLTITLPDALDKRARYSGYAALSTSSLAFTVVPA
jgi:hypothetical protein